MRLSQVSRELAGKQHVAKPPKNCCLDAEKSITAQLSASASDSPRRHHNNAHHAGAVLVSLCLCIKRTQDPSK